MEVGHDGESCDILVFIALKVVESEQCPLQYEPLVPEFRLAETRLATLLHGMVLDLCLAGV